MPSGVYVRSEETIRRLKENPPRYWIGKHRDEQTKEKLRLKRL